MSYLNKAQNIDPGHWWAAIRYGKSCLPTSKVYSIATIVTAT